jgi:hypothetical protein
MSNIITAGNATNGGTAISSDTSGILELKTGSTPTTAITVDTSQNVGIGTSSPSQKLTVAGAGTAARLEVINTSDLNRGGYLRDTGSTFELGTNSGVRPLAFAFDGSEKMRIDSSGNLLLGTGNTTARLNVAGGGNSIYATQASASSYTTIFNALNQSGTYYLTAWQAAGSTVGSVTSNGTNTSYGTTSDYRLKENIAPMTGALAKVAALKPCTYKWKVNGSDGEGFIAHELAEVCPHAVTGKKDAVDAEGKPVYQGIDVSFLVATLTKAIQEQQALIVQLQADVAALKGA